VTIAGAVATYYIAERDALRRVDSTLQVAVEAISMSADHEFAEHATQSGGESDLRAILDVAIHKALKDTQIVVLDGTRIVAFKPASDARVDLRNIKAGETKSGTQWHGLRCTTRSLSIGKLNSVYLIVAAKSLSPVNAELRRLKLWLLSLVPLALGVATGAGFSLANRTLSPLKDLAETVEAISSRDLKKRVKLEGRSGEIYRLGSRFNTLLDRLDKAFSAQRMFMADASHELRTPISVALTTAQVTRRDPYLTTQKCRESLKLVERQMLQLRRTVNDLFFLSQHDNASLTMQKQFFYMDDIVTEAYQAARVLAETKSQVLLIGPLEEAACTGDSELLKQALLILLDNAIKFTPEAGRITVELMRKNEFWACSIADTGIGIPKEAQSRVFERFFRGEQCGRERTSGAGLGLSIAQAIASKHSGYVRLVHSQFGTTVFEMGIPVASKKLVGISENALCT
jgi:two-component system, OmpR family, sensor kinase